MYLHMVSHTESGKLKTKSLETESEILCATNEDILSRQKLKGLLECSFVKLSNYGKVYDSREFSMVLLITLHDKKIFL